MLPAGVVEADISASIFPLFVDDKDDVEDDIESVDDDDEGSAVGNLRCCCCRCGNKYSISFRS